jgi:nucleotide-binding universal stress UspA family protein
MMTRIIVGTDGTEASHVAVRWALERAAATGAHVSLVHVVDDDWETVGPRIIDDLRREAIKLLERDTSYVRSIAEGVVVESELMHGDPMHQLAELSKNAALVVVGTHKTGYIHGKVIGSRTLRLVAAAHCPVAVIPESVRHDARGIVVGVDCSAGGRAAVELAADEASRASQPVTLLRGWVSPKMLTESEEARVERDRLIGRAADRTLDDAAAEVRRTHPEVEFRRRAVQHSAPEALLEAAASARMLVVGSTRRASRERMGLGQVTHDVVLNLVCPTVVVHADDRD